MSYHVLNSVKILHWVQGSILEKVVDNGQPLQWWLHGIPGEPYRAISAQPLLQEVKVCPVLPAPPPAICLCGRVLGSANSCAQVHMLYVVKVMG